MMRKERFVEMMGKELDATRKNLDFISRVAKIAKSYDVSLLAFPELYLPGYALSMDVLKKVGLPVDHEYIKKIGEIAKNYSVALLVPYAEKGVVNDQVYYYDSMVLYDKNGIFRLNYRKTHLFGVVEKSLYEPGKELKPPEEINGIKVSFLNCYEAEFPELTRIHSVNKAEFIVIPTAAMGPATSSSSKREQRRGRKNGEIPYPDISKLLIPAAAYENFVFVAYANRMGVEITELGEWYYRGNSVLAGPHGDLILVGDEGKQQLLIADVIPHNYQYHHPDGCYLADRRPEMYSDLVRPNSFPKEWCYDK